MARRAWDISDEFWAAVEPLLPARERRFRYPGRKPIEDRAVLQGIIFVLVTGIPWKALPIELGFGSGQTCHRRLCEWTEAGVWPALHAELLKRLRQADQLDWDRVCIDASHVQAKRGRHDGPEPGQPRQAGREASSDRRRLGHPACILHHARQPARCQSALAAARPDSSRGRPDRPATPQATAAVRRSWLRLPDPPPPTDITRHPAQHRPTWPPARLRPRRDPLRRRAQLRLAAPPPSPRHLLRTPPRHPRRTLRHRLHPHLLATPRTLI
jgi:transposase